MRHVILIAALLASFQAWAGGVTVIESWTRATVPGQESGTVYLRIVSQQEARIIAVASSAADSAGMHSMTHENGVMRMRELEALPLPAGQEVELSSSGSHIMLTGLKQPFKAGDSVPLTLTIQLADKRKEKIMVKVKVKPFTVDNKAHEHQHKH